MSREKEVRSWRVPWEQCCSSTVSGGGSPRGQIRGGPCKLDEGAGVYLLGPEGCCLTGELEGQVSSLDKALRKLPGGNET